MRTDTHTATGHTAHINNTAITVESGETLLQAALRQGIDFPHACRVGGCGSCKCRVVEGQVRELTETGYLLSKQELDAHTILACQSVPRGDVRIEVALAEQTRVSAEVIRQERLTHDITHLVLRTTRPMAYQAGQYALLSFDELPGVERSYSFATPAGSDEVHFFIRHVPGGAMSSYVHSADRVGERAQLVGPQGDFTLRDGTGPLLFVAGGSGLAPILAILRDQRRTDRPVTVLFGARAQRDLYALDELEALADRWHAPFEIVTVLSDAANDASWTGPRGWVTEHIPDRLDPDTQAYLCGPPAMVDAALDVLAGPLGEHRIFFDRFATAAELTLETEISPGRTTGQSATAWQYAKFMGFHLVGLASGAAVVLGGPITTVGLIGIVILYVLGDAALGDDTDTPEYESPGILTFQLWMALPLLCAIVFGFVWSVSTQDFAGFGATLTALTGYDFLAARAATHWVHHFSGFVITGLMIGMVGTIPAHELTHRTWDPISMLVGRWLLAFSFDTIFSIEHVYGHHRYVSTIDDPATAPRGRSVYAHVLISTVRGNVSAWRIERDRLRKRGYGVWSLRNAFLRGHAMSFGLVALAYWVGGLPGLLWFVAAALMGKSLLEIVNYMEHYGMVRNPEVPVQPRHSWNTNKRITSWTMFNLSRHSHHHAQGEVPYHELSPYPGAPMMVSGYLSTILLTLVPPVWHRVMAPKLREWDRVHASPEERVLAKQANARSGIAHLLER